MIRVIEARSAFYGCYNLTSLKFENLNTTQANNLNCMFCNCYSLEYLYFPLLTTNHISYEGVHNVFEGCKNLSLYIHRSKNIELVYNLPSSVEVFDINETLSDNYIK